MFNKIWISKLVFSGCLAHPDQNHSESTHHKRCCHGEINKRSLDGSSCQRASDATIFVYHLYCYWLHGCLHGTKSIWESRSHILDDVRFLCCFLRLRRCSFPVPRNFTRFHCLVEDVLQWRNRRGYGSKCFQKFSDRYLFYTLKGLIFEEIYFRGEKAAKSARFYPWGIEVPAKFNQFNANLIFMSFMIIAERFSRKLLTLLSVKSTEINPFKVRLFL